MGETIFPTSLGTVNEWTIRTGAEADVALVLALWSVADTLPTPTDTEEALAGLLARDPDALLVAEREGAIVGSVIAAWDGWRGSFYRLAVDPDHRRRGLATALVRAGERRLGDLGARRLTAIVADDEAAAIALWESAGYRRQAQRGRFVRANDA